MEGAQDGNAALKVLHPILATIFLLLNERKM